MKTIVVAERTATGRLKLQVHRKPRGEPADLVSSVETEAEAAVDIASNALESGMFDEYRAQEAKRRRGQRR